MNLKRSVMLMQKYAECIQCGNEMIGNGEGSLNINEGVFTRTCKCGWKIEIKEEEDEQVN